MQKSFITIIALAFSLSVFAQWNGFGAPQGGQQPYGQRQHNGGPQQKQNFSPEQFVKELKDFVTKEAQLTPAEASKFFPMLFEMQDKTRKIQEKQRELSMKAMMGENNMTEAQYAKTIDQITKMEVTAKEIEQSYYKKFHTVLSWKKVYKVRVAINKFHMYALSRFQPGRRNFNPQQGPQGNQPNRGWQNGR